MQHGWKLTKRELKQDDCYVVIAAYREEPRIADVVHRVRRQGYRHVVVVDDGSKDKTEQAAIRTGATVLRHIVNLGKGAAMKTGADYAKLHGAKALIFIDADGQHKPENLPLFLKKLNEGYDIVFGSRQRTKTMPAMMRIGNWFFTTVVRLFYNIELHDVLSGYRAMSIQAYGIVRWNSRDYGVESEMIARAGKNNLRYAEFDIATIYHDRYKGTTILDGIPLIVNLIWWRMTH